MNWIKTENQTPTARHVEGPEYANSEDVLMYFADRDCYCLGWYDQNEDDWFIWCGMEDSTRMDGPPDFWMALTKPVT